MPIEGSDHLACAQTNKVFTERCVQSQWSIYPQRNGPCKQLTYSQKQLKCLPFWAKLASFGQLGLISDPYINSLQVFCENSDRLARMFRLICVFTEWTCQKVYTTKTCLYNFDPLKPHFHIVKSGFTWVYINFLISAQKHRFWLLVKTASLRRFYRVPTIYVLSRAMKNKRVFIWTFSVFWKWDFQYIWIGVFS